MPGGLTYSTGDPTTNDNEFSLLAKLARAYGATPVPNDNEAALLKKVLVAVNAGVVPEPPSHTLLGSFDLAEPGDIDTFTRATAAGYTGSGETAFQREAAVDALRSAHYVGGSACVLLEREPTVCALVAPGTPAVTPGEAKFSASWAAIPVTASLLRYEYRLDGAGSWTTNGTGTTLTDIAAAPGNHVLNVRAVSTSGVAGATATSATFTVTAAPHNPPASPLFPIETFEGAGYVNAGWTEDGASPTINEDYTATVLDGSQSLFVQPGAAGGIARIYKSITASGEVWAFFQFRPVSSVGAMTIFEFWDSGFAQIYVVTLNANNTLKVQQGATSSGNSVGTMADGTTYNCWAHFKKGAGGTGVADFAFSTTTTRPTSGDNFVSVAGSNNADATRVVVGLDTVDAAESAIYDYVLVDDAQIGDNP